MSPGMTTKRNVTMNTTPPSTLEVTYILDPMCSWCYAFAPSWRVLCDTLDASTTVRYVMGGLAPDSDMPMPESMRRAIANTWHVIEQRAAVTFNHDYWRTNTPFRSTYPACRAAIAAEKLRPGSLPHMVEAIQKAYYQHASNPSLEMVLLDVAESIGLDRGEFAAVIGSAEVRDAFDTDLKLTRVLGVQGFPTVLVARGQAEGVGNHALVSAGYLGPDALIEAWHKSLHRLGV